ncbi:MAG: triose-phosphate isomerase family protein, partial [Actinomycetales bacterium]
QVDYVLSQVRQSLAGLTEAQLGSCVVAYEPVWAIGTGRVATPEDAQEVCAAIRQAVADEWTAAAAQRLRILYGGSVKANNIADIMLGPDIDGALVGGASLDADEFVGIVRYRVHAQLSGKP